MKQPDDRYSDMFTAGISRGASLSRCRPVPLSPPHCGLPSGRACAQRGSGSPTSSRPTSTSRHPMGCVMRCSFIRRAALIRVRWCGPMSSACGPQWWTSASGSRRRGIRCSCRIRSIGVGKTPFPDALKFDFKDSTDMKKCRPLMAQGHAPGNVEKDAPAHIAFLDAQKEVDTKKKIGVQGYCMGGPMVVRTAAAVPDRVGAGASFHGGGLVTDGPDSPHLLAPKIKAQMYFAIAASDDEHQPDAKDKLKAAFANEKAPEGSRYIRGPCMGGVCRTCRCGRASRSTARPTPSGRGGSWCSCKGCAR